MNATELFRAWSMESGQSEECGSVSEGAGWAGLFIGPFTAEEISDTVKDEEETMDDETRDEIKGAAAAILYCDTLGFYSLDTFKDEDAARAHWAEVQSDLDPPADEDETEEDADDETEEDADDETEEDRPTPGDYTLTPSGSLGGCTSVGEVEGKFLGEFRPTDELSADEVALKFIRARMEKEQYWPNIWSVSDHGNWTLVKGE